MGPHQSRRRTPRLSPGPTATSLFLISSQGKSFKLLGAFIPDADERSPITLYTYIANAKSAALGYYNTWMARNMPPTSSTDH